MNNSTIDKTINMYIPIDMCYYKIVNLRYVNYNIMRYESGVKFRTKSFMRTSYARKSIKLFFFIILMAATNVFSLSKIKQNQDQTI